MSRRAERRDRGDALGTGARAALLPAAFDQRLDLNALVALDQSAGALKAAELVRAKCHEIQRRAP